MSNNNNQDAGRNAQEEALSHAAHAAPSNQFRAALAIAVLGIVYGDIGTSPIYALRESFAGERPIPLSADNVFGILSLIFWTLARLRNATRAVCGIGPVLHVLQHRAPSQRTEPTHPGCGVFEQASPEMAA